MKTLTLISIMVLLLRLTAAFAHGEDKAGPNGGFIRMPGAFHTEVVPSAANSIKIYLLDVQWKNPSVLGSSLVVTHKAKKDSQAKCTVKGDHYACDFPKEINLSQKAELVINAQRENQKGNVVSYELPLELQVVDDGHNGRH